MEEMFKREESINIKKSTIWQIVSGVLGILLVISIFTSGFGYGGNDRNSGVTGNAVGNQPSAGNGGSPSNIKVSIDNDPVLGKDNAPVTLIEFSDFQCPFCRKFWKESLPSIKSDYIDAGKVKFVYRDFPLTSIHPGAQPAAEAAECARDQGKFWEMHDKIFQEQDKQGQGTIQFDVTALKSWAADLKLDTKEFNDCLDSGKYTKEVQADGNDAISAGGRGTPYFILIDKNGKTLAISGAQPYANFKAAIDAAL